VLPAPPARGIVLPAGDSIVKSSDRRVGPAGWLGLLAFVFALGSVQTASAGFELKDGDRVVLLGGTFIERDQSYGHLETLLTCRFVDRKITFRNLGWSGDTVWGEARSRFGPPAEGFAHLKDHVEALKPTVLFVNYGLNESFAGMAGLANFEKGLNTLLDVLDKTKARIVLITPRKLEKLAPPLPDPAAANARLADYVAVLKETAKKRNYAVVDLFNDFPVDSKHLLTDNGVHLTDEGYLEAARVIVRSLGLGEAPEGSDPAELRDVINAKNELYFHRWRPQNETYLFGFRKHEQGNNAREIPLFDPLVEAKEAAIGKLKVSAAATYKFTKKEETR
jgi:lysophospholipase L1-like esterase